MKYLCDNNQIDENIQGIYGYSLDNQLKHCSYLKKLGINAYKPVVLPKQGSFNESSVVHYQLKTLQGEFKQVCVRSVSHLDFFHNCFLEVENCMINYELGHDVINHISKI